MLKRILASAAVSAAALLLTATAAQATFSCPPGQTGTGARGSTCVITAPGTPAVVSIVSELELDGSLALSIQMVNSTDHLQAGNLDVKATGTRTAAGTVLASAPYSVAAHSTSIVKAPMSPAGVLAIATASGGGLSVSPVTTVANANGTTTVTTLPTVIVPTASADVLSAAITQALQADPRSATLIASTNPAALQSVFTRNPALKLAVERAVPGLAAVLVQALRSLAPLSGHVTRLHHGKIRISGRSPRGHIVKIRLTLRRGTRTFTVYRKVRATAAGSFTYTYTLKGAKLIRVSLSAPTSFVTGAV